MAHRRYFLDQALLYLFSTDVEFGLNFEQFGVVEDGARFNLFCVSNSTRVYNVLREREVGARGYPVVSGKLLWGEDASLIGSNDVAFANVRATIQTDDGELIDAVYHGVMPMGLGVFRSIAGGVDGLGTAEAPAEFRLVITPTYQADPQGKYAWLNDLPCVGFGRVQEIDGTFRRVTYDMYAMI
jgi:hypothetical protein